MHDIDRTQAETWGTYEYGPAEFGFEVNPSGYGDGGGQYEAEFAGGQQAGGWGGQSEMGYQGEYTGGSSLPEMQELELTAELLGVQNEQELDQFLGNLFRRVSRGVGRVVRNPAIRQALGGVLKTAARSALPMLGPALGSAIPIPGVGQALGAAATQMAGKALGLELEGLSGEDQEFELARNYVRLASAATQEVEKAPPSVPPPVVAQRALAAAAQQFAPGLLNVLNQAQAGTGAGAGGGNGASGQGRAQAGTPGTAQQARPRTGRWIRRGQNIILFNVYR